MNHDFYIDRLSAYFDQELKNEEFVMVDQHVQTCSECQAILKDFEKFDKVIEENSQLAGDEYFEKAAQRIEAAISGPVETEVVDIKEKSSSMSGLWWKLAGVAATLAVIAFVSLYESDITKDIELESPDIVADSISRQKELTEDQKVLIGKLKDDSESFNDTQITTPKELDHSTMAKSEEKTIDQVANELNETIDKAKLKVDIDAAVPETVSPSLSNQGITTQSAPPSKEVQKSEPVERIQKTKKRAAAEDISLALDNVVTSLAPNRTEEATGETSVNTDDSVGVDYWIERKAQLETSLSKLSGTSAKRSSLKQSAVDKLTNQSNTKTELTLKLLEANYKIASLTESESDKDKSVDYLKEMTSDSNKTVSTKASEYLEMLGIKQ